MLSTRSTSKWKDDIYKWCTVRVPFSFCVSRPTLAKYWAALSPQGARMSLRVLGVWKVWTLQVLFNQYYWTRKVGLSVYTHMCLSVIPSRSLQHMIVASLPHTGSCREPRGVQTSPCAGCWEKAGIEFKHVRNGLTLLDWGYDLLTCLLDSKFL